MRVGVEYHDDVASRLRQTEIDGSCLASILRGDEPDAGSFRKQLRTTPRGAVRRAVVDHDDIEVAVRAGQNMPDGGADHLCLIIGRNKDGDGKVLRVGRNTRRVSPAPAN